MLRDTSSPEWAWVMLIPREELAHEGLVLRVDVYDNDEERVYSRSDYERVLNRTHNYDYVDDNK